MPDTSYPSEDVAGDPRLAAAPMGAFVLAGAAVGLLLVAWLAIYFFMFLQRGPVG